MAVVSDQIGDLLTRIRNATAVKHAQCKVPFSVMKMRLLQLLKDEGFIQEFEKLTTKNSVKTEILITLKYKNKVSVIQAIKRVSKPGTKHYVNKNELPRVRNGLGMAIISTSHGLMTDNEARMQNLGGEVIALVW